MSLNASDDEDYETGTEEVHHIARSRSRVSSSHSRSKPTASSRKPTASSSRQKPTSAHSHPTQRIRVTTSGHRPERQSTVKPNQNQYPYPTQPGSNSRPTTARYPVYPTKPAPTQHKPNRILTTRRPHTTRPTTTPPKMKWKLPASRHAALFGGLGGTALGAYLGYQIGKIQWEADVPAYSVRHYWHQQDIPTNKSSLVEGSRIVQCPKNVKFCLDNTKTMCLSHGKVYCVVPEYNTQPCANVSNTQCVSSTVKVKCDDSWSWGCFFTGWKYEEISVPCIKRTNVVYKSAPSTVAHQFFLSPTMDKPASLGNTCKCNSTQISKFGMTCIKLNISDAETILCSGLNLANQTSVGMNATLNTTNSKTVSCLPTATTTGLLDIFTAQRASTLSRCEMLPASSSIEMACGHVGNLSNNVSIPIDQNVIALNCNMANATYISNSTCSCNSTKPGFDSFVSSPNTVWYSTSFCIYVDATPTRLYNNKDYMGYLRSDSEEKAEVAKKVDGILSTIGYYIFF